MTLFNRNMEGVEMSQRKKSQSYMRLRAEWRSACEDYWKALTVPYSDAGVSECMRRVAALSVELHLFEMGRRSAR